MSRRLVVWRSQNGDWHHEIECRAVHSASHPANVDESLNQQLKRLWESLAKARLELEGTQLEEEELRFHVDSAKAATAMAFGSETAAFDLAAETEESALTQIETYEKLLEDIRQRLSPGGVLVRPDCMMPCRMRDIVSGLICIGIGIPTMVIPGPIEKRRAIFN